MKQAFSLLYQVVLQAAQKDELLQTIAEEKPFDATHYAQVEAERNTLTNVAKMIEWTFKLGDGQAELALRNARNK